MSRTSRLVGGAAALAVLLAPGAATALPRAEPGPSTSQGRYTQPCGGTSWYAGTTNLCDGAVVYRDYVNDDAGADLGERGVEATDRAYGRNAPPAGDVRYPAGDISSADLVSLTLTRRGDRMDVVAQLAALYRPDSTVLAVAVGDADRPAESKQWGELPVRSSGWDALHTFTRGDVRDNTIRGSFPLPQTRQLRLQAVTAQSPTGPVMNVAFRGPDEAATYVLEPEESATPPSLQSTWFEEQQAAALTAGDISPFGFTVDVADVKAGKTRLAEVGPGLHERVYTSQYTVPGRPEDGEGFSYQGVEGRGDGGDLKGVASQFFSMLGTYQPYGVYIPAQAGPHGMQMVFHGSGAGISSLINQPGIQRSFGDELNRVLVVPLVRGQKGGGSDWAERDLLDVMADTKATFPVDEDRVFASGYSQGGYVTFRTAEFYPQMFAGFISWVGFNGEVFENSVVDPPVSGSGAGFGNVTRFVGNLRHVPGSLIYAAEDAAVPVNVAVALQQAFDKTDNRYAFYLHNPAQHLTFAEEDDWQKEADDIRDLTRVQRASRVTYRTDPELDFPAADIRHDRAYWVSELRGREDGPLAIDLTSHGCGVETPVLADKYDAGQRPAPWTSIEQEQVDVTRTPAAQLLEGSLDNVASLTVDTSGACVDGSPLRYSLSSEGPAVVSLSDGRTIDLQEGQNDGVLSAVGATAAGDAPPGAATAAGTPATATAAGPLAPATMSGTLPATGGATVALLPGLALLVLGAAGRAWLRRS